jgi:hypothetical protein
MTQSESPLYPLLNEINTSASSGLPLIALGMTFALPDICVSLSSEDGRTDGVRYKKWCDDNLDPEKFSFVTSEDLYSMRCGILHNGRFGDLKHNVGRVIFVPPPHAKSFANNKAEDAYLYGVVDFCRNFTDAVFDWFEASRDNHIIKMNLPRLMQYREEGLSPYISGVTVLA